MDTSVLSPKQWGRIFILLSLDRVDPVLSDMGLRVADRPRQKAMLRRLILENRKEYEADPSRIPDLAGKVLDAVAREEGPEAAERLFAWATTVFAEAHEDQPQWSAWSILVNSSPLLARARAGGVWSLETADLVERQRAAWMDRSSFEANVAAAKAAPLSDWDLQMYAIHRYNEEDELSDPFSLVGFVVELNRFQEFWTWLVGQLAPAEKDALLALGQRILGELGVWMPAPLEHPDRLRRRL